MSTFQMPTYLSAVNQEKLLKTLEKHFDATEHEDRSNIREQLRRAQEMINGADEDMVQPILTSFIDHASVL